MHINSLLSISEPDKYRFRIAALPLNVMDSPHSEKATPILLTIGQTGDQVKGNIYAYLFVLSSYTI